jgi:hypothetical protein
VKEGDEILVDELTLHLSCTSLTVQWRVGPVLLLLFAFGSDDTKVCGG